MSERTPRRWWWLAALAAAGLGIVFLLADSQPAPPHVRPDRAAPASGAPSTGAAGAHDTADVAATATRSPAERTEPATGVLVIVDELDQPVPGADVAWQRVLYSDWHEEPLQLREHAVRTAGVQVRADAQGRVFVQDAPRLVVVARDGDRYGQAFVAFEPREGPPRVLIAHEVTVQLVAVDAQGAPQPGVPIELAYRSSPDEHYLPWRSGRLAGTTGSDGRLAIPAVQTLPHWPPTRPRIALRAMVFGGESEFVEVDLRNVPAEVRVTCPPFGRALLQVVGPDGFAVRTVPDPIPLDRDSGFRPCGRHFAAHTAPNEVLLGPLALDLYWNLGSPFANGFFGPKQPGETVTVLAPLRAPQRSLLVLGLDGQPLRNTRVHCGPGTDRMAHRHTDAAGLLAANWAGDHGWVFSQELLAAAPAAGVGDGGTIRLSQLLRTTFTCVDAATGEPVAAAVWHEPRANPDVAIFCQPGQRLQTGVISDRGGMLHLQASATGYKPTAVDVSACASGIVVPLHADDALSLAVRLRIDDDLPVDGIDARLFHGNSAVGFHDSRRTRPGEVVVRWDVLTDEPHRVEIRLANGIGPVHTADHLRGSCDGGIAAVIDLRGIAAVATFEGPRGHLCVSDGTSWGNHGVNWNGAVGPMLLPKGAEWQGFLVGGGLPVLVPIHTGRNATSLAPFPTLRPVCPGAGAAFDPEGVAVGVRLLRRVDPLLDAFEAATRSPGDPPPRQRSPDVASLTREQLTALEAVGGTWSVADLAEARHQCPVRGIYLVVPFLGNEPLLDQITQVAIDGTAADVVATLAIDPVRLAAARAAQAKAKEPGEGR